MAAEPHGRVALRRDLLISLVLAVIVGAVQLLAGTGWGLALLTAAIGFVIALGALAISDRYSRR